MKRLVYILLPLLLLLSCAEDETVDVTVMPAETTEGLNTFGCLIDGWVYVGGRYAQWVGIIPSESISFYYNETADMEVSVCVKPGKVISFTIQQPGEGKSCIITNVLWDDRELPDGTAVITRFDTDARIISGRFESDIVNEGRFDVRYSIR
ncbi:hypothetical protein M2459_002894 [Parabacteroides sp. PF5-5]|uniref:hypothetical protein n=1 Tax=unclassified Parabacteroides TaxID=2649774 RepID=UPI002473EB05|nr:MULTISPECIES: hypothetical protein [unclassified Parabacteroides]MDH6306180.1 hypothetical protein [Parabacteroides sp. PH5-39]MDH6317139.1 hypothetical protein [Parabacteroides sp. PF5-13]MDH6320892.1 hypothetical protein [Parabacteroides sp. PH5-13]MDH6324623.1 hypothetical protein [Parabacteroides sp. PH5-8]MDH6328326.1 hypothetical protein [Parabacteroides sp. PH5-41]